MPYIKKEERKKFEKALEELDGVPFSWGDLNYFITRLCLKVMGRDRSHYTHYSYSDIAALTGVLENVKQEFYRRFAVPYEDNKRVENGDVY